MLPWVLPWAQEAIAYRSLNEASKPQRLADAESDPSGQAMKTSHALNVEFLFDFVSPNSYMCHKVIPGIEARTGARMAYQPIFLGGLFKLSNNQPRFVAFADVPNKMAYERIEMQRFVTRHRLEAFKFNPHFPVNTLPFMRAAVAAQQIGCFERYVNTVFVAMWERGLKMDDPVTFGKVLSEGGLDAELLMKTAQEPEAKARLVESTQLAHDRGAFGVPTFFIDDELYFGKERLREFEERLVS